ncbi:MAG: polysaccharide pyruvyl transferase family protein, partial [bacterium]|nr:polysaccharide pyruvyl transferase family protein [bacterium]
MKISIFGASPDTDNMGVSALFASATAGLNRRIPHLDLTIFDMRLGVRVEQHQVDNDEPLSMRFIGIRTGHRYYRAENLANMKYVAKAGWLGRRFNPGVRAIMESNVVLDVSGGDSFTDMYPDERIELIAGPKEFVLDQGRPLLLLPQTYGPFDESLDRASRIVRRSAACFARDERSFENLKSMLGADFDPDRHRCGVDMAFGLAARDPEDKLDSDIRSWIDDPSSSTVGLNLSGLIGNIPGIDKARYGFKADYRQTLLRFVSRILTETEAKVLLIPHVMTPRGL